MKNKLETQSRNSIERGAKDMKSTQPPRNTVISVMTILHEWRGHDSLALLDPSRLTISTWIHKTNAYCFRGNINGVDLNRNFPDMLYDNPAPIEPETQVIMDWLSLYPFILSATFHDGALLANYVYDNYEGG